MPDTAECLAEIWAEQDAAVDGIVALVTGLRCGEKRAVAEIVDELMQDGEYAAHEMLLKLCLITAAALDDECVPSECWARYARVALQRTKR